MFSEHRLHYKSLDFLELKYYFHFKQSTSLCSPDGVNRTNEILKYNQDFNLKCVEDDEMICSTPKMDSTLGSATYCPYNYFKNGEMNQSVGLAVKKV